MPTTHVLLVTDQSGSMDAVADDVRGGFNAYLQSLVDDLEVTYRVTAALFADGYTPTAVNLPPQDVPRLDKRNYRPGGMTALLDAIGKTITDFERAATLAPGDRVLLVVQTDGRENRSREYTVEGIRKMIADRETGGAWGTVFLGAGPDTWRQGRDMGFGSSVSYAHTGEDTRDTYDGLTKISGSFSRGRCARDATQDSGLTVRER
jgi:Mg-chelatase subunit ChlD